jgi:hypothetical protein
MPILVTAEDISSAIVRIDAAAQGVNDVFAACPQLDAGTKAAWSAWYAGWQAWEKANNNLSYFTLGLPAIGNQAIAYENDVAGWQEDADRICSASIPVLVTQTKIADQNAALGPGWNMALDALKWIVGAVVLAVVVPPIAESIRGVLPARKKNT